MTTNKQITISPLTALITSCGLRAEKKDCVHNYEKYRDKYSDQPLIDTLFSDTLNISPDTEDDRTTKPLYISTTNHLITDLQDYKNIIDSLYPITSFEELTIKKLPLDSKKTFSNERTTKFLEINNIPISFDRVETTNESEFQCEFFEDSKVVASLTITADKSVIKTNPDSSDFKKTEYNLLQI